MRILVAEDDAVIAEGVAAALRGEGHLADVAATGPAALDLLLDKTYALVLLDLMLPGKDGFTVCRELRRRGLRTPVLMLTARDGVDDRVRGLDEGADDYLVKPFAMPELLARVRALLRRETALRTGVLRVADLEVDTRGRVAKRGHRELRLTPREYELLEALAKNAGRVLTREAILERVWGNEEATENVVSFHVASLRKKVDPEGEPKLIRTVHGFGYSMSRGEES